MGELEKKAPAEEEEVVLEAIKGKTGMEVFHALLFEAYSRGPSTSVLYHSTPSFIGDARASAEAAASASLVESTERFDTEEDRTHAMTLQRSSHASESCVTSSATERARREKAKKKGQAQHEKNKGMPQREAWTHAGSTLPDSYSSSTTREKKLTAHAGVTEWDTTAGAHEAKEGGACFQIKPSPPPPLTELSNPSLPSVSSCLCGGETRSFSFLTHAVFRSIQALGREEEDDDDDAERGGRGERSIAPSRRNFPNTLRKAGNEENHSRKIPMQKRDPSPISFLPTRLFSQESLEDWLPRPPPPPHVGASSSSSLRSSSSVSGELTLGHFFRAQSALKALQSKQHEASSTHRTSRRKQQHASRMAAAETGTCGRESEGEGEERNLHARPFSTRQKNAILSTGASQQKRKPTGGPSSSVRSSLLPREKHGRGDGREHHGGGEEREDEEDSVLSMEAQLQAMTGFSFRDMIVAMSSRGRNGEAVAEGEERSETTYPPRETSFLVPTTSHVSPHSLSGRCPISSVPPPPAPLLYTTHWIPFALEHPLVIHALFRLVAQPYLMYLAEEEAGKGIGMESDEAQKERERRRRERYGASTSLEERDLERKKGWNDHLNEEGAGRQKSKMGTRRTSTRGEHQLLLSPHGVRNGVGHPWKRSNMEWTDGGVRHRTCRCPACWFILTCTLQWLWKRAKGKRTNLDEAIEEVETPPSDTSVSSSRVRGKVLFPGQGSMVFSPPLSVETEVLRQKMRKRISMLQQRMRAPGRSSTTVSSSSFALAERASGNHTVKELLDWLSRYA